MQIPSQLLSWEGIGRGESGSLFVLFVNTRVCQCVTDKNSLRAHASQCDSNVCSLMIKQAYRQQVQIGETDLTELSIHEMRAEEATIRDELQFVQIQIS